MSMPNGKYVRGLRGGEGGGNLFEKKTVITYKEAESQKVNGEHRGRNRQGRCIESNELPEHRLPEVGAAQ